jgi:serine/threonine-protein kinase
MIEARVTTDSPPPAVPEKVGRYRILRVLGRGSMGRVYLAHDPNTDRRVALKVVLEAGERPEEAIEEARRRFLVEARAAGRLSDPGVVPVYDADVDPASGAAFLAMEWVDGPSLAAVLKERGALPWREAAGIAAAAARALAHAHERGIVHRDVKPGNVLIDGAGRVRVTDFGIAKIGDETHTQSGAVVGTPNYISPEQLRGEPIDGRADLFALGALLYRMVTGEAPFHADDVASTTFRVAHVDPRPPSALCGDLPAALEKVILRALAKHPEDRFADGAEMAAALAAVAAAGADTVSSGPVTAAAPRSRREWMAILLVLLAIATGLVLLRGRLAWTGDAPAPASRPVEHGAAPAVPSPASAPPLPSAAAATPAPVESATLEIRHFNRLRRGTMTVWVDGVEVWSESLAAPRSPIQRLGGQEILESIAIAPGAHDVEVRIRNSAGRVDARGVVHGNFAAGGRRQLRVVLVPLRSKLQLDWES